MCPCSPSPSLGVAPGHPRSPTPGRPPPLEHDSYLTSTTAAAQDPVTQAQNRLVRRCDALSEVRCTCVAGSRHGSSVGTAHLLATPVPGGGTRPPKKPYLQPSSAARTRLIPDIHNRCRAGPGHWLPGCPGPAVPTLRSAPPSSGAIPTGDTLPLSSPRPRGRAPCQPRIRALSRSNATHA
jgi:hypothetical protein